VTRVQVEVREIVLTGFPRGAAATYAEGLGALVAQRVEDLVGEGHDGRRVRDRREVEDQEALVDLVAQQVWLAVRPHVDGGASR
jgi:hypothetical protein